MKRIYFTAITLLFALQTVLAQANLDLKLIEETVKNEKEYYNDILKVYLEDDPLIRLDDLALVYYGHSYMPEYRGSKDSNEEALKNYVVQGDNHMTYNTAKKILEYNPVNLNALFYAWRSSESIGCRQEEINSYVTKYLSILNMITTYGDGKSSRTPFRVISPDDQDHILYGILEIENIIDRKLDTETLCNIITVEPSDKFKGRTVYIDVSRFLSHTSEKR